MRRQVEHMQKQGDRKEGHWVGRELQQIMWWGMRGPGAVGAIVCVCVCVHLHCWGPAGPSSCHVNC